MIEFNVNTVLFILIVLQWGVEVYHVGDVLEVWGEGIAGLEHYHDVELPDVEEMDQRFELIFWHFGV